MYPRRDRFDPPTWSHPNRPSDTPKAHHRSDHPSHGTVHSSHRGGLASPYHVVASPPSAHSAHLSHPGAASRTPSDYDHRHHRHNAPAADPYHTHGQPVYSPNVYPASPVVPVQFPTATTAPTASTRHTAASRPSAPVYTTHGPAPNAQRSSEPTPTAKSESIVHESTHKATHKPNPTTPKSTHKPKSAAHHKSTKPKSTPVLSPAKPPRPEHSMLFAGMGMIVNTGRYVLDAGGLAVGGGLLFGGDGFLLIGDIDERFQPRPKDRRRAESHTGTPRASAHLGTARADATRAPPGRMAKRSASAPPDAPRMRPVDLPPMPPIDPSAGVPAARMRA
ncbi:hypothetical protein HDZ31DRAFT_64527 [Schizophyllum fasciatum]